MMDVGAWLRGLGLERYEAAFRDNEIDETVLPALTAEDLKDLGVVVVGHRRKLLGAIAALRADAKAPLPDVDPTIDRSPKEDAERRQVTVMFSDLVGSTALSTRMDPEDLREVISAYQNCVGEIVRRFGGFVAKYMGDGVLIYFGYPQAHEDDAERAVRAGLELIAAVAGLKTRASLQIRVGIATGVVVVGDLIGSGEAQERGIVGETPNFAARLQGIAEPNTVVIAESTRRLVGNLFELQDLGARELKGIAGPVRAWAALRASSVESRFEAMHACGLTALVGREEELELLLRRWSRSKTGEGQVVLLSGEAGIGKSRLTAALLERLATEPHTRLRYFCSPQHTDSALYPIIGQMERAAGLAHDDTLQAKLDKLDALLAQTSTSIEDAALLAEMLSLSNDGRYPALVPDPQHRRQRTLEALIAQTETLTQQKPVLMIFEDAHWTDPTSLEVFSRVMDRVRTLRVLLIVTFRPEFEPPWIGRAACDRAHDQSTGRARNRRDDRPRRRQQAPAGEHPAGHRRAHRRHSAVRGGDDEGGSGGGERGRSAPHCRRGSVPGPGGPREPARVADGAARPARPRQGGGADRGGDRAGVLPCAAGRGSAQAGGGAQCGARPSYSKLVCCSGKACRRKRHTCSSTPWCRTLPMARCCASGAGRCMPASPKC